jgi:hypothetical protein
MELSSWGDCEESMRCTHSKRSRTVSTSSTVYCHPAQHPLLLPFPCLDLAWASWPGSRSTCSQKILQTHCSATAVGFHTTLFPNWHSQFSKVRPRLHLALLWALGTQVRWIRFLPSVWKGYQIPVPITIAHPDLGDSVKGSRSINALRKRYEGRGRVAARPL